MQLIPELVIDSKFYFLRFQHYGGGGGHGGGYDDEGHGGGHHGGGEYGGGHKGHVKALGYYYCKKVIRK